MIEIRQRYILNQEGTPVAVQIPIEQFEHLLTLIDPQNIVSFIEDEEIEEDLDLDLPEVQQKISIGLQALDQGDYKDYDEAGLKTLFSTIKSGHRP